jgi:hypothetical protein
MTSQNNNNYYYFILFLFFIIFIFIFIKPYYLKVQTKLSTFFTHFHSNNHYHKHGWAKFKCAKMKIVVYNMLHNAKEI